MSRNGSEDMMMMRSMGAGERGVRVQGSCRTIARREAFLQWDCRMANPAIPQVVFYTLRKEIARMNRYFLLVVQEKEIQRK